MIFEDFWLEADGGPLDVDGEVDEDLVIREIGFGNEGKVEIIFNINFFIIGCLLSRIFFLISLIRLKFRILKAFHKSQARVGESTRKQSLDFQSLDVGYI